MVPPKLQDEALDFANLFTYDPIDTLEGNFDPSANFLKRAEQANFIIESDPQYSDLALISLHKPQVFDLRFNFFVNLHL